MKLSDHLVFSGLVILVAICIAGYGLIVQNAQAGVVGLIILISTLLYMVAIAYLVPPD